MLLGLIGTSGFRSLVEKKQSSASILFSTTPSSESTDNQRINAIAWNLSQDKIAVGRRSGIVEIRNASDGQIIFSLTGHTDYITSLDWSLDGTKLASSSADKTVRLWNTSNGQLLFVLTHSDTVWDVAWSADSSEVFSITYLDPNNLNIWNASTGQRINQYTVFGGLGRIILNADSGKMLFVMPPNTLEISDTTNFAEISRFHQSDVAGGDLVGAAWNSNIGLIATGSLNSLVKIWNVTTGVITNTLQANMASNTGPISQAVMDIKFSPDGSTLLSVSNDGSIRGWNTATWELTLSTQLQIHINTAVAFSPDSSQIAYGVEDGTLHIVSLTDLLTMPTAGPP
ncbi:MAG: hypothetical protein H0X30_00995 [Anaerolineae bacterium]|nr:hypothetical protein [Anaerolineae bacterium]